MSWPSCSGSSGTNLALLNALFFSMAAGICVSAFGRESQRVMGATLGVVVLVAGCLPGLAGFGVRLGLPAVCSIVEWVSPLCPFAHALQPGYVGQPEQYWRALGASQLFGWLLLGLASLALPHHWQERAAVGQGSRAPGSRAQRESAATAARARTREELLPINPVLWLVGSEPGFRRIAWMIVGGWGAVILLTTVAGWGSNRG